jgi:imidazolonepropionase-like amidohydrolase
MIAIVGATLHPVTGPVIEKGTLLIENGKIKKIGQELQVPSDAQVIDGTGTVVTPGIIEAHGHLGIMEEGYGWAGNDTNEMTDPATPFVRALDGINPFDKGFEDAREGGITSFHVMPGSANVIGGQTVVIKTYGTIVDEMVVLEPAGLKIAFGENPKRVYGQGKNKMPMTRMGIAAILRENLIKGQEYLEKIERAAGDPEKMPARDLGLEAIGKALQKQIPLRAHAHRSEDIVTAIRIAEEFGCDITIEHCTEGHKIAEFLKQKEVSCAVGPTMSNRSKVELIDKTFETPVLLNSNGNNVAISTDHPVIPIEYIRIAAGMAARAGMGFADALKAITYNPALHLGIQDRVGSLEVGKDADVVVWTGHPLELGTEALYTIIDGQIVYSSKR